MLEGFRGRSYRSDCVGYLGVIVLEFGAALLGSREAMIANGGGGYVSVSSSADVEGRGRMCGYICGILDETGTNLVDDGRQGEKLKQA